MELGDGFAFVGEKVRVQVGNQDFELDLLFYHRDLRCLVAFELKTGRFEPEHMGKLAFYLEALDRDRKRPHENPSIGVLLCRTKDDEVVEYAMNRHLSPALVAQYETQMIPKTLLRKKLHEWSLLLKSAAQDTESLEEASVWANQKAFVFVRPTCHFLIKLFCVGGNEGSQATVLGRARALGKRSDDTFMTNAYAPSWV
jgi:hypothetical protein